MTRSTFRSSARRSSIAMFVLACVGPFLTSKARTVAREELPAVKPAASTTTEVRVQGPGRVRLVRAGDDLQAALDSAVGGDTLVLKAGATFAGNFVLPAGSSQTGWITITSDAGDLPAAGVRVQPLNASSMPKIVSPNSQAAARTAPRSQFLQFIGIEFGLTLDVTGNDGLILLGDGDRSQNSLDQVPHDFLIDRCYIHGNPLSNSKRGIALNCAAAVVQNSHISDFHAVGFDTQAIAGWNGPGPFVIRNNYLEASGENTMFGGADPSIPGLVPSDIEVRQNFFSKPMQWMSGILQKVQGVEAAATFQADGRLIEGLTYYYRVTATLSLSQDATVQSAASDEIAVQPGPGQKAISLIWPAVPGATGYSVYRTTDPQSVLKRSWTSYSINGPAPSFTDTGLSSPETGRVPTDQGTRWSVKNLFELKNAHRVVVDGNVFQNNWLDAQTGYAILFKSVDQDGTAPWSSTDDVTFTNNVVRNVASGINILGADPEHPSGQTCCVTIRNSLFYGIDGPSLGGEGTFLKITGTSICVVDHNTIIQSGNIVTAYGTASAGFIFSNNIAPGNTYGIKGDGTASGNSTMGAYFPDGSLKKNVIVTADGSAYPRNNYYPSSLSDVGFVDLKNLNLRLSSTSPFVRAGTKGSDVGADIDKISRAIGGSAGPN